MSYSFTQAFPVYGEGGARLRVTDEENGNVFLALFIVKTFFALTSSAPSGHLPRKRGRHLLKLRRFDVYPHTVEICAPLFAEVAHYFASREHVVGQEVILYF